MPKLPFVLVGICDAHHGPAHRRPREGGGGHQGSRDASGRRSGPQPDSTEALMEQMRVHALEIQLAPDLVDLVGSGTDQDLLARVRGLRRKIAMELGFVVPPVRTRDSVELPRSTYVVKIAGVEVGRGEAPSGRLLGLGRPPGPDRRHARARAGLRPHRQVDSHRDARSGRARRRHRRRPRVRARHPPRIDHHDQRLAAPHPRGRARSRRGREAGQPRRGRRTRSRNDVARRGAAGAPGTPDRARVRSATCLASSRA